MHLRLFLLAPTVIAAALAAGVPMSVPHALAQNIEGGEAKLAAAAKALDAGQYSSAVSQFTKAMRAEDLPSEQIARAFYLRGVANRNADRPAQAISDITSALYLQGLSGKERAEAHMNRALAYEAVGLKDQAQADRGRARQIDPNAKVAVARTGGGTGNSSVPAFSTQVETARRKTQTADIPDFQTQVEAERRKPKRQAIPDFQTRVAEEKTRVATRNTQRRAPAPKPKPEPVSSFRTSILPDERSKPVKTAPAPPVKWNTSVDNANRQDSGNTDREDKPGSTVGRFLSGLWGGNKDDDEKPAAQESAGTATAAQWGESTRVAAESRTPAPAAQSSASAPAPAPTPAPASSSGSGYRIQLAAVRSQQEADAAWKRLSSRHKALLGGQTPVIQRTELGSLGTFYRVQLGPFADKKQSAQLCNSFKRGGLDCFVLAE